MFVMAWHTWQMLTFIQPPGSKERLLQTGRDGPGGRSCPPSLTSQDSGDRGRALEPTGCTAGLVPVIDLPVDQERNLKMRTKAGHALTED